MLLGGELGMWSKHARASIKLFVAFVLILVIGLDICNAQSLPERFRIKDITAHTDKSEYLRNETIDVIYTLNCSGKSGDKSFSFKENDNFDLVSSVDEIKIIYPPNIGFQSDKPMISERGNKFKVLTVPLFDNNSNNLICITKIPLSISLTSGCRLNRTFDLTDRSFVELVPQCEKRVRSEIKIINKNPEIVRPVINGDIAQLYVFSSS